MNKYSITVLLCYVLWGLLPIFWKLLGAVDPMYILACRSVWSLAAGIAGVLAARQLGELRAVFSDRATVRILAVAALLLTVNWGSYIWCVNNGHVLDASLAYYINPILTILAGAVIYKEKLTRLQWLSVALAAAGVIYPMIAEGQFPYLAVMMAATFAVYGVIKKKLSVPSGVSISAEMLFVLPFALALIAVMEVRGDGAVASGALSGWSLLLLPAAGIVTYIPLALFSYGVRGTSLSLTGILMYINPTLQLIIGVTLYGEELTRTKIVTFIFVWVAVIFFVISGRAAHREHASAEVKGTINA